MKRDMTEGSYGAAKAKLLSSLFRQLVRKLASTNITVIVVSQIRDKMNAMPFGKKWQRSGGTRWTSTRHMSSTLRRSV
jgi:RecA/RadA recombinase